MPYKLLKNKVFREVGNGLELVKAHPTRKAALSHFRALQANTDYEQKSLVLRAKSKSKDRDYKRDKDGRFSQRKELPQGVKTGGVKASAIKAAKAATRDRLRYHRVKTKKGASEVEIKAAETNYLKSKAQAKAASSKLAEELPHMRVTPGGKLKPISPSKVKTLTDQQLDRVLFHPEADGRTPIVNMIMSEKNNRIQAGKFRGRGYSTQPKIPSDKTTDTSDKTTDKGVKGMSTDDLQKAFKDNPNDKAVVTERKRRIEEGQWKGLQAFDEAKSLRERMDASRGMFKGKSDKDIKSMIDDIINVAQGEIGTVGDPQLNRFIGRTMEIAEIQSMGQHVFSKQIPALERDNYSTPEKAKEWVSDTAGDLIDSVEKLQLQASNNTNKIVLQGSLEAVANNIAKHLMAQKMARDIQGTVSNKEAKPSTNPAKENDGKVLAEAESRERKVRIERAKRSHPGLPDSSFGGHRNISWHNNKIAGSKRAMSDSLKDLQDTENDALKLKDPDTFFGFVDRNVRDKVEQLKDDTHEYFRSSKAAEQAGLKLSRDNQKNVTGVSLDEKKRTSDVDVPESGEVTPVTLVGIQDRTNALTMNIIMSNAKADDAKKRLLSDANDVAAKLDYISAVKDTAEMESELGYAERRRPEAHRIAQDKGEKVPSAYSSLRHKTVSGTVGGKKFTGKVLHAYNDSEHGEMVLIKPDDYKSSSDLIAQPSKSLNLTVK